MGLKLAHRESQTRLGIDDIGPFPLSPGADENGDNLSARLDYGIPLIDINSPSNSLQDNGIYLFYSVRLVLDRFSQRLA